MVDMVSYGDRVYCVVCCDSVSKISALPHTWIWCVLASRFSVAMAVWCLYAVWFFPSRNYKDDARSNKHKKLCIVASGWKFIDVELGFTVP